MQIKAETLKRYRHKQKFNSKEYIHYTSLRAFFPHKIMTPDKWLQGKCAKRAPLLFTACHRLVQYKKKMNASFLLQIVSTHKGKISPHPNNGWLRSQINNVVVAWWVYGNTIRKIESYPWISLQGDSTLAEEAEEAQFIFSTGATLIIFKLPFGSSDSVNAILTYCYLLEACCSKSETQTTRCQGTEETLLYIRWFQL